MYGVVNNEGEHIDVSKTERGAKCYATRHGYKKVSKRYGHNAIIIAVKLSNGRWYCDDPR